MSIKNVVLTGLLVLSANCFAGQEVSIEEQVKKQDEMIQSLLEGRIDTDLLDYEALVSCIEILEGHKAVLKHIIAKRTGFANNIDAIKGVTCGWFGFNWFCNNLLSLLMHYEVRYGSNLDLLRVKKFISNNTGIILFPFMFMVMSGMFMKDSYNFLYKAWHIKENALNDLAKTEELLNQLSALSIDQ